MTVTNNSASSGTGVRISTSAFLLTEVNIEALTARDGIGVQTVNVSPRINEVFARVNAGSSGIGFEIIRGGTVITQSPLATDVSGWEGMRGAPSTACGGWRITTTATPPR